MNQEVSARLGIRRAPPGSVAQRAAPERDVAARPPIA